MKDSFDQFNENRKLLLRIVLDSRGQVKKYEDYVILHQELNHCQGQINFHRFVQNL